MACVHMTYADASSGGGAREEAVSTATELGTLAQDVLAYEGPGQVMQPEPGPAGWPKSSRWRISRAGVGRG